MSDEGVDLPLLVGERSDPQLRLACRGNDSRVEGGACGRNRKELTELPAPVDARLQDVRPVRQVLCIKGTEQAGSAMVGADRYSHGRVVGSDPLGKIHPNTVRELATSAGSMTSRSGGSRM